jgi:dTDP-4-dehydrorhamnose reductase
VSDKVLIFGSTGQLGTDLVNVFQDSRAFDVIPLTHADADCTDAAAVRKVVLHLHPQFVINSAAYVRVDDCEDRPSEAFGVNAIGALNIARVCAEVDALSVYISTDYVFDGTKEFPYVESDSTNPINVYGTSKLAGELLVRQTGRRWLIVRVSSLFGKTGARGKGGNFIETILAKAQKGESLRVIDDNCISPTYTSDAARAMRELMKSGVTGIVHTVNSGSCSWYKFAKEALDLCGLRGSIEPVPSAAFSSRARRPKNSVLSSERLLADQSPFMTSWPQALRSYLIEKGHITAPTASVMRHSEF